MRYYKVSHSKLEPFLATLFYCLDRQYFANSGKADGVSSLDVQDSAGTLIKSDEWISEAGPTLAPSQSCPLRVRSAGSFVSKHHVNVKVMPPITQFRLFGKLFLPRDVFVEPPI